MRVRTIWPTLHDARVGFVLWALFACSSLAVSQSDTLRFLPDSIRGAMPRAAFMQLQDTTPGAPVHETKSPWLAVGLSAALPGAGQIYTKSYWKVPVIWGLGGYWVYEWVRQNNKYKDFRARYSASITPTTPQGSSELLTIRDFYRDQRDSFAWYMGFAYLLNLVDAYVDAQLYDFDVTPELSLDGRVSPAFHATVRLPFR